MSAEREAIPYVLVQLQETFTTDTGIHESQTNDYNGCRYDEETDDSEEPTSKEAADGGEHGSVGDLRNVCWSIVGINNCRLINHSH